MDQLNPSDMTPEQAAAYVNATCVVAMSEIAAMHWENVRAQMQFYAGKKAPPVMIPHSGHKFIDRIAQHCVTHQNVLELFDRARGKP